MFQILLKFVRFRISSHCWQFPLPKTNLWVWWFIVLVRPYWLMSLTSTSICSESSNKTGNGWENSTWSSSCSNRYIECKTIHHWGSKSISGGIGRIALQYTTPNTFEWLISGNNYFPSSLWMCTQAWMYPHVLSWHWWKILCHGVTHWGTHSYCSKKEIFRIWILGWIYHFVIIVCLDFLLWGNIQFSLMMHHEGLSRYKFLLDLKWALFEYENNEGLVVVLACGKCVFFYKCK